MAIPLLNAGLPLSARALILKAITLRGREVWPRETIAESYSYIVARQLFTFYLAQKAISFGVLAEIAYHDQGYVI